eukprot:TRINITY_DN27936_c0_g1_i1.p1 TRINITY_DN27936_c0_g1~~TRINITY_DN27936_c0_g1_i1.p1  ORF type:complete len:334 (-),score=79.83 TRINITY_DN27936_c0_g1_i1:90-1091(-)
MAIAICFFSAWTLTLAKAQDSLPDCKPFREIYPSGKELCEKMWGSAFRYEPDEAKAYTMWFFDSQNPNDAMAKSLGKLDNAGHDTCGLQYFHKTAPGPESNAFTECHPWKDNACCAHGTVETYTKLKEGYGAEYHWDRCGPISQACERFFVQEACFYECDPNAGLYRKYNASVYDPRCDSGNTQYDEAYATANSCASHNAWEMHGMPIKASYCDAWFDACRNDKFCSHDDGNFFSCAAVYESADAKLKKDLEQAQKELEDSSAKQKELEDSLASGALSPGAIVGIVVPSVLAVCGLGISCLLVQRERAGKPMFGRLLDEGPKGSPQEYGRGSV